MKKNTTINQLGIFRVFVMLVVVLGMAATTAYATSRTFNTGSYILSTDGCWQGNNDPAKPACPTPTDPTNPLCTPTICDTNKNDKSLFQLFGMLYALLDTGDQPDLCINNDGSAPQQKALFGYCKQIKAYWIIDNTKASSQTPDLTLSNAAATATDPIITIYNSAKTNSGTTTSIPYKGGPFVIDGNDMTTAEFNTLKAKFPSVKIHKANIPFSGNVDKVLIGKPPKIAVLNEGASDVLEAYIRAAGSFAWRNVVFQYVGARDIVAGCLEDPVPTSCNTQRATNAAPFNETITSPFSLLWAPHWIVEDNWGDGSTPTVTEQRDVISKIRSFLERGNSGFFECASIESMEGSRSADGTKEGGVNIGSAGGFTIASSNTVPRIQTNGGCSDTKTCASDYLKFEQSPFWLTQCGGWTFGATGGHVHNMRPYMDSSYNYLTTKTADDAGTTVDDRYSGSQLTRFIHDDSTKLNSSYSPGTGAANDYYLYDYLVGGRINGSPTQGYAVYLPGHSYIKCTNSTTYNSPPSRTLELDFNVDPPTSSSIFIEVVHTGCTYGSTCPKVNYNLNSHIGTRTSDSKIDLSAEFASFDPGSNKLSGVFFTSSDPNATTDLQITDIYATFDGNGGTVKLTNIVDMTEIDKRQSLCAPDLTSTLSPVSSVRCSLTAPASTLSLTFSSDISAEVSKVVSVKVLYSGGPVTAQYDILSLAGTVATVGNLTLDMRSAAYDSSTNTLSNIIVKRGATCADVSLTDVEVTFPGSSKLTLVYNDSTSAEVCAPDAVSPATCSGVTPPVVTSYFINTELYWQSLTPPANTALALEYTCSPACTTTSISASRGNITTNADLKLDFKNISSSSTKLSNIRLTIADGNKTVTLTKLTLTYTGSTSSNKTVSYKDTTNNATIKSWSTKTNPSAATIKYNIPKPAPVLPPSAWTYLIGKGICSYYVGPYLSSCDIDWTKSNTCGIKYVLNTFLALKYQSTSSEFSKTQPLVKDGILYKASFDYPSYRGHLKMIKVPTSSQASAVTVWDAASYIPYAGTASFPSAPLSSGDTSSPRYIFTNLPGSTTHIKFDPVSFAALDSSTKTAFRSQVVAGSDNDAIVTINTVRGRKGASTTDVYPSDSSCTGGTGGGIDLYGCAEDSKRLWAIENSTPALKTKSKYVESTAVAVTSSAISAGKDRRDRILFAGGDDGMLHAFWAGTYDPTTGTYPDTAAGRGTGKEIWSYIPSALLSNIKNQPFTPDPSNEASFEPKVTVDGSPALGDFLICKDKNTTLNTCNMWEWKTRLVGTATVRSENRGIIFSLDVTDPYNPQLLWENSYDKNTDSSCSSTSSTSLKNCNMGNSMGVAIGTAQIGDQLKDHVFLTSSWISKKKVRLSGTTPVINSDTSSSHYNEYEYDTCSSSDTSAACVNGVSAYALDLDTGKVMWERMLPYTGDAVNINVTPAVPALMDRDNNGSYDYVVFGDMQGRLWALRTTDGKNLTDIFTSTNHVSIPVYQVKNLVYSAGITDDYSTGVDAVPAVLTGSAEPIAAPVSVYRDYVVLATGGADYASNGSATDAQKYRVEVVKIGLTGGVKDDNQTVVLTPYDSIDKKGNEKVWGKPAITSDLKVYIGTARSYYSNQTVSTLQSDGRILVVDLKVKRDASNSTTNVAVVGGSANQWQSGGFVGGFDFDKKHAYIVTLKPSTGSGTKTDIIQIGSQSDFSSSVNKTNPYKILWWRKM